MSILQNAMVTIMQEHFDAGSFINYDTILPKSSSPDLAAITRIKMLAELDNGVPTLEISRHSKMSRI